MGNPIDGKGQLKRRLQSIESPAPSIIDRQPVHKPETGILVIDSMFPIGHGQRELIVVIVKRVRQQLR